VFPYPGVTPLAFAAAYYRLLLLMGDLNAFTTQDYSAGQWKVHPLDCSGWLTRQEGGHISIVLLFPKQAIKSFFARCCWVFPEALVLPFLMDKCGLIDCWSHCNTSRKGKEKA